MKKTWAGIGLILVSLLGSISTKSFAADVKDDGMYWVSFCKAWKSVGGSQSLTFTDSDLGVGKQTQLSSNDFCLSSVIFAKLYYKGEDKERVWSLLSSPLADNPQKQKEFIKKYEQRAADVSKWPQMLIEVDKELKLSPKNQGYKAFLSSFFKGSKAGEIRKILRGNAILPYDVAELQAIDSLHIKIIEKDGRLQPDMSNDLRSYFAKKCRSAFDDIYIIAEQLNWPKKDQVNAMVRRGTRGAENDGKNDERFCTEKAAMFTVWATNNKQKLGEGSTVQFYSGVAEDIARQMAEGSALLTKHLNERPGLIFPIAAVAAAYRLELTAIKTGDIHPNLDVFIGGIVQDYPFAAKEMGLE